MSNTFLNDTINDFQENAIGINNKNGKKFIGTDYVEAQSVETHEFTGDDSLDLIEPTSGCKISVRGVLISTSGNAGVAYVRTKTGKIILPLYAAQQSRNSPAGRIKVDGAIDEAIEIITTGFGAGDLTFFGVSYLEIKE